MLNLNRWITREDFVFDTEDVGTDELNLIELGIIPKGWVKIN